MVFIILADILYNISRRNRLFTVKLIKRWSAKYIIISKDELDPVSADKAGSTKTK